MLYRGLWRKSKGVGIFLPDRQSPLRWQLAGPVEQGIFCKEQ